MSTNLYSLMPDTAETQFAKQMMDLQSEVLNDVIKRNISGVVAGFCEKDGVLDTQVFMKCLSAVSVKGYISPGCLSMQ